MHSVISWDDLRFLLHVQRAGTYSQAARDLGVTHTTVSRRLHALQEAVGTRLFDTLPEGISLTAAADPLVDSARRMEEAMHDAVRGALGHDASLRGEIHCTTVPTIAEELVDVLRDFTRAYPAIELEVATTGLPLDLTRREADVAIRATNNPPEHLVGRRVARMELAIFAADSLLAQHPQDVPLESLPWLAWTEASRAVLTERWMKRYVPDARIALRLDTLYAFRAALAAGVGIGFLPLWFAQRREPPLRQIAPIQEGFGMDIWVLTHPDLRRTARIRAFMDHMAAGVAATWPAP